jgi:hypothetical protein
VRTYNPETHFCDDTELDVVPGGLGVRGWDAFHSPACIIGQYIPPGRLIIHDVCVDTNVGVRELTEMKVKPLLKTPKYADKIHEWRDIGDPSARTPDQSTTATSAARVIEQLLGTRFEPGPTRWQPRIDPVTTAFTRLATDGRPLIILSKSAYLLHRALNGGWHWKVDNNGHVIGNTPVKDQFSHPGDAFLYMASTIFPFEQIGGINRGARKISQRERMARALSYSSSRGGRMAAGM